MNSAAEVLLQDVQQRTEDAICTSQAWTVMLFYDVLPLAPKVLQSQCNNNANVAQHVWMDPKHKNPHSPHNDLGSVSVGTKL